jgi:hypothetical protein
VVGLPISDIWRGHGSAIFLEFGRLTPTMRVTGEAGKPEGEFGLMVEWSWRVEMGERIICGSWSDEALWQLALTNLKSATVDSITTFGELPEIVASFSNGMRILSFMTAEGDPAWALFDRRGQRLTFHSRQGRVIIER